MNIERITQRLADADHHIRHQNTGTPKEFAEKLNISESLLYELLATLKKMGGPIAYSRNRNTYYYEHPVAFKLGYDPASSKE